MKDVPENKNSLNTNFEENGHSSKNKTDKKAEQSPKATQSKVTPNNKMKQNQTTEHSHNNSSKKEKSASKSNQVTKSSTGRGIAWLALLVALGLGGAGYFFAEKHLTGVQLQLDKLEQKSNIIIPDNSAEIKLLQQKMASLEMQNSVLVQRLAQEQQQNTNFTQQLASVQAKLESIPSLSNTSVSTEWLYSEADFLLNNALRKLVLDDDVDIAISLLKEADNVLSNITTPQSVQVRLAIKSDLKRLANVNVVDQNAIMQDLSQLANEIDSLPLSEEYLTQNSNNDTELSSSVGDWKQNMKKTAESFLNRFIRIQPRNLNDKALLPPDQEVYLRENIRLRLQIAILAVPRQQNQLYKDSLETVASWVRSYFDTNATDTQDFLKKVDLLKDQSIYIDVPDSLESLTLLDQILHLPQHQLNKIQIKADKGLTPAETNPTTNNGREQ